MIRKCLLGATDLLRMWTMFNSKVKKVLGFCFPKLPKKQGENGKKLCVIELEVCWKQCAFVYKLTPLKTHADVEAKITETVAFLHKLESIDDLEQSKKNFVLQLSSNKIFSLSLAYSTLAYSIS